MKHTHKFDDLVPSDHLEYVNLKCKCGKVKTVDAIEYFNPEPVTHYAVTHKI